MTELRHRPGDQPLPVPNSRPHTHDLVAADIQARKALGTERYGTPLQPGNGRDSLRDAYEEALDLCVYLRNAMEERDRVRPPQCRVQGRDFAWHPQRRCPLMLGHSGDHDFGDQP